MTLSARWLTVGFGLALLALGAALATDTAGSAVGLVGLLALAAVLVRPDVVWARGLVGVAFLVQVTLAAAPGVVLVAVGVLLLAGFLAAGDGAGLGSLSGLDALLGARGALACAVGTGVGVTVLSRIQTGDQVAIDLLLGVGAAAGVLALLLALRAILD